MPNWTLCANTLSHTRTISRAIAGSVSHPPDCHTDPDANIKSLNHDADLFSDTISDVHAEPIPVEQSEPDADTISDVQSEPISNVHSEPISNAQSNPDAITAANKSTDAAQYDALR